MTGVVDPIPGVIYPPEDRLSTYVEAGELKRTTIPEELWKSFEKHAELVALCTADGVLTYGELDDITDRLGGALVRLGLKPLDRVLFQAINSKELVFALIACFKAGLIPVCTLAAHREKEIGYIGCHVDARAHIVQGDDPKFDLIDFAKKMQAEIPTVRHILTLRGKAAEGTLRLEDLAASEDRDASRELLRSIPRDPFQVAIFQLSGGTTGVPKVIPRMQSEYLLNATLTAEILGYRSDDVMFMPMQIIHNACMICFWLPTMLTGATFTIPADLTPESWADLFRTAKPTFVGLIRALIPRFDGAINLAPEAMAGIRAFWSPDSARALRVAYNRPAYAMFGMSEGMNMYVRQGDSIDIADWTVGRPMSRFDEVRLVRPGTREVAELEEIGELEARGPYTISGYYNAPERNAEAFTPDGYYKTGDLIVSREIDGKIVYAFAGRTKDVVDRGNEKINCEEVEHAVLTHASVSGCAVVGMPDPVLGERVCAFVTLREGHDAPDVPAMQVHLQAIGMAKFKWPERIETIDTLPVTKVGKLDKAALRQEITSRLEREKNVAA